MKLSLKIISFFILFYLLSCSNSKDKKQDFEIKPEILYSTAIYEFENKNYDLAVELFEEIELKYPLSNEAIQSQIMVAFIDYMTLEYDLAILKLDNIINRYPSYKDIDYAYYMKAICYYEQIENPDLDGKYNILALQSFEETINRFPNSKYAKDSQQKIILIKENIAAKHMNIAMFYLKQKKYLAALRRYQKVIDDHDVSKFVPEALHRLVEIYYTLGMVDDAKKTAAVLGYNYPKSKWYKYSYDIVGEKEASRNKKDSFLKKIIGKISSKNED